MSTPLIHYPKSEFDIHNIESVFSAFEIGKTLGRFSDCASKGDINKLIKAMIQFGASYQF